MIKATYITKKFILDFVSVMITVSWKGVRTEINRLADWDRIVRAHILLYKQ